MSILSAANLGTHVSLIPSVYYVSINHETRSNQSIESQKTLLLW